MAQLQFFTGPMDCGKSTLALQMDYTHRQGGRLGRLYTCLDRAGDAVVSSRLGLSERAIEVTPEFDIWADVIHQLTTGRRLDYLICDEAQFYQPRQIDQLARLVDDLNIEVFAFGIMSDFRTRLFPGSARLVELADRLETLPVRPLCWCGRVATHNARTADGEMVTEGDQVVVGDTVETDAETTASAAQGVFAYEVLCRRHHRERVTHRVARKSAGPDPLLFEADPVSTEQY